MLPHDMPDACITLYVCKQASGWHQPTYAQHLTAWRKLLGVLCSYVQVLTFHCSYVQVLTAFSHCYVSTCT